MNIDIKSEKNPKIIVFACNWCSSVSWDLEEVSRFIVSNCHCEERSDEAIFIIRLMCSGRFHPSFALKSFELGADGVLIIGCQDGECHYISGNKKAKEQFEITKNLLHLLGIRVERIKFESISKNKRVFMDTIKNFVNSWL